MTESTVYPAAIEVDTIISGIARLLCHWDLTSSIIDETVIYSYEEAIIDWTLPSTYISGEETITIVSRTDVENYVAANATEIMDYAKATKITV